MKHIIPFILLLAALLFPSAIALSQDAVSVAGASRSSVVGRGSSAVGAAQNITDPNDPLFKE